MTRSLTDLILPEQLYTHADVLATARATGKRCVRSAAQVLHYARSGRFSEDRYGRARYYPPILVEGRHFVRIGEGGVTLVAHGNLYTLRIGAPTVAYTAAGLELAVRLITNRRQGRRRIDLLTR